ncbi:MAG: diaminopimelate epimerase [Saprospiraceae bacterium]|nr:diaminopimelate epimerase [Saprospiraceae bacterium]
MAINIPFHKYQGAGNDFVMVDNRAGIFPYAADVALIARLCHRRFGIGADGLILLENAPGFDFRMVYFNADGRESSMCGNGGRCIVAFAKHLGLIGDHCRFIAIDGPHEARMATPDWVELKMTDVVKVTPTSTGDYILNTGSPHYVQFVDQLDALPVAELGRKIRYSETFREEGINVNFVEPTEKGIAVATYERGVEDETLSCGTGVTAAAIALYVKNPETKNTAVSIATKGGQLQVRFKPVGDRFEEVWLCGPAVRVFEGMFPDTSPA